MKPRKTPPTRGLAAVVHARLVRLLDSIEDGIETRMEQLLRFEPILPLALVLFITALGHGESWGDNRTDLFLGAREKCVASPEKSGSLPESKIINKSVPHGSDLGADSLMVLVDVARMGSVDMVNPSADLHPCRSQSVGSGGVASQIMLQDRAEETAEHKEKQPIEKLWHKRLLMFCVGISIGMLLKLLFDYFTLRPFLPNDERMHHYQRRRTSITGLGL